MNAENFVYWLNGFFEISGSETLSKEQVQVVKEHLKLVLTKKTSEITIANSGLGNGIVVNPLYRGQEIVCATTGVVPLTVGPVKFEDEDPSVALLNLD